MSKTQTGNTRKYKKEISKMSLNELKEISYELIDSNDQLGIDINNSKASLRLAERERDAFEKTIVRLNAQINELKIQLKPTTSPLGNVKIAAIIIEKPDGARQRYMVKGFKHKNPTSRFDPFQEVKEMYETYKISDPVMRGRLTHKVSFLSGGEQKWWYAKIYGEKPMSVYLRNNLQERLRMGLGLGDPLEIIE